VRASTSCQYPTAKHLVALGQSMSASVLELEPAGRSGERQRRPVPLLDRGRRLLLWGKGDVVAADPRRRFAVRARFRPARRPDCPLVPGERAWDPLAASQAADEELEMLVLGVAVGADGEARRGRRAGDAAKEASRAGGRRARRSAKSGSASTDGAGGREATEEELPSVQPRTARNGAPRSTRGRVEPYRGRSGPYMAGRYPHRRGETGAAGRSAADPAAVRLPPGGSASVGGARPGRPRPQPALHPSSFAALAARLAPCVGARQCVGGGAGAAPREVDGETNVVFIKRPGDDVDA
jgi:translation initiation factor IF-2